MRFFGKSGKSKLYSVLLLVCLTALFSSSTLKAVGGDSTIGGISPDYSVDGSASISEVVDLRTESSKTYHLGDGHMRLAAHIGAVHYKDNYENESEAWKDINLSWDKGRIDKAPFILENAGGQLTMTDKRTGSVAVIKPSKLGDVASTLNDFDIKVQSDGFKLQRVINSKEDFTAAEFDVNVSGDGIIVSSRAYDADGNEIPVISSSVNNKLTEAISLVNLDKAKYPITIDPLVQVTTTADSDDAGNKYDGVWTLSYYIDLGAFSGSNHNSGLRFLDVTIPEDATILSANVTFISSSSRSTTTINEDIYGEDNATPATFSTEADFLGRTKTTAMVNWDNVGAWIEETPYDTPDISTIVQELVDTYDYSSGRNMSVFIYDDGSSGGTIRHAYDYYENASKTPVLNIEYTVILNATFIPNTDANASTVSDRNYTFINTSMTSINGNPLNASAFIVDWNGTNITVLDDSLLVAMSFNGNLNDWSNYGNDGVANNGANCSENITGVFGDACHFDGSNDFVNIANGISTTNGTTFEMWIRSDGISVIDSLYTLGTQSTTVGFHWFYLYNGNINWQYANGAAIITKAVSFNPTVGKWYHVAVTHDYVAKEIKFYVNGAPTGGTQTHADDVVPVSNKENSKLGTYTSGTHAYYGAIDEFRVWNRVLTSEEINLTFRGELGRYYINMTNVENGNYTYSAYANNTEGSVNTTEVRTITFGGEVPVTDNNGTLAVTLNNPDFNITQNDTASLNASFVSLGGNGHQVNFSLFCNEYSDPIVSPVNTTEGEKPFYNVSGNYNVSYPFIAENEGGSANVTLNGTGAFGAYWCTWNVTTNNTNVLPNGTRAFWLNISLPTGGTCDCPTSGNWVISDGSSCDLKSDCNLGSNKFECSNGKLYIYSGATLTARGGCKRIAGCLYTQEGGKRICG